MNQNLSLYQVLENIEIQLNNAISSSKNSTKFTNIISSLEEPLKLLNQLIISKADGLSFNETETLLIKKIILQIDNIEKKTNIKLEFFNSLNKYFYDNIENK